MDNKKHFASLMEDHAPGPSETALRPLSPFRNEDLSNPGLNFDLGQKQAGLSCVTKETSQEDCARHRFIVWAAVKRNSSVRMTAQERLECPLLRCTSRFPDHETMLKHLAGCRYLPFGEYWCYDHMRVERFDDLKCKRCLGHPSKRRRILHKAKEFFHSLGHKSKKNQGTAIGDDEGMLAPPPSYDSLNIPNVDGTASELPSTEILEIDSLEVPLIEATPVQPPSDVIDPQALLMPSVPALPELDSTMLPTDSFIQWPPVPIPPHNAALPGFPVTWTDDISARQPAPKPMLQLDTAGLQGRRQTPRPVARPTPAAPRSKGLSPSSSVRSTASTDTNATTISHGSSMISPASNWSGAWSMGSGLNTGMTSPVDGIVADDMFAEALNSYTNDACPDNLHEFFVELPADLPMLDNACDMGADDFLGFDAPLQVNMSYAPDIILTDDADEKDEPLAMDGEKTDTCCSETKSLVSSAWDALQEHILSSMVKIRDHRGNHLAKQLETMSVRTVATTGLRTLRRTLVDGHPPSSASDALCLIHLIYAFSLVLHEQESSDHFNSLFLQALSYANGLPPNDRDAYRRLVTSIWQPPDLAQADTANHLASLSNVMLKQVLDAKGKSREVLLGGMGHNDDPLLTAARDFLDELEISIIAGQGALSFEVQVSDLHMRHLSDMASAGSVNGALVAAAKYVLETLAARFGDAGLTQELKGIYQRLGDGSICTVRRLEVEILQAGRSCLPSNQYSAGLVPQTRSLCDRMYEDLDVSRRLVYHGLGVSLIESLIPEFDNPHGDATGPAIDDIDAFFSGLESESGSMGLTASSSRAAGSAKLRTRTDNTQLPTPAATSNGSPSHSQTPSQTSSPASEQPQQPAPPGTSLEQQPQPSQPQQQAAQNKVEADSCCDICGYRPKGDPQWFKGSMAKHRKLQHSAAPPRIYKCPFPGCTSQYRNRPDNLRQHQIEKNHWVEGEGGKGEGGNRRPSKRRRTAAGEEGGE